MQGILDAEMMPAATASPRVRSRISRLRARLTPLLAVPLIFVAARGSFSFQSNGAVTGGFVPGGAAVRDAGMLGSVILPGIAYLCVLLLVMTKAKQVFYLAGRFKALSLLAVLAVASSAWSQQPLHSLISSFCYCVDTLFAFYLVAEFEPEELLGVMEKLLLILCAVSLAIVVFLPKYGLSNLDVRNPGAWAGLFSSRSDAGRAYLFPLIATIILWARKRTIFRTFILLFGLVMLYEAHVMTEVGTLCLAICCIGISALSRRVASRTSMALLLVILGVVAVGAAVIIPNLPALLETVGRDPTLTGRTEIWAVLMQSIAKRPLEGYGYYAFWQGLVGESGIVIHRLNWTFGYAHNGYIEIMLQLGLGGLALFLVTLFGGLRNAWTCFRKDRTGRFDWYICILLLMVVENMDDCLVLWPKDMQSILYLVACCSVGLGAWKLRQEQQTTTVEEIRAA